MLILIVRFWRSIRLVEMWAMVGIADDYGALRTDNMRRAIPPSPHWLSFVKFNDLTVIDIGTERPLGRLDVSRERIR
jgi:hypothetical protein